MQICWARCVASLLSVWRPVRLPVLRLSVAEVVEALAQRFGIDRRALVTYAPEPFIEKLFASYPPLSTPEAQALGLAHDGTVAQLITRSMA